MTALPSQLSYAATPADSTPMVAAEVRNPLASILTTVNSMISTLGAGVGGQVLTGTPGALAWGGTYQTYVPTWASSGTASNIGTSTVVARYVQVGKLVHAYGQITFAGATFGTGSWSFVLPVTSASLPSILPIGNVYALDTSASAFMAGWALPATTTTMNIQQPFTWPTGVQQVFAQTVPVTWANGDIIAWNILYEAA